MENPQAKISLIMSVIGCGENQVFGQEFVRPIMDFIQSFQEHYRHTPVTLLIRGTHALTPVFEQVCQELDVQLFFVPDFQEFHKEAEYLCRFGHLLLDLDPSGKYDGPVDKTVRCLWDNHAFSWQDEEITDILLPKPDTGPVFALIEKQRRQSGKKTVCLEDCWRSVEGDAPTRTSGKKLFRAIDKLNRDCARMQHSQSQTKANTIFANQGRFDYQTITKHKISKTTLDRVLAIFGRADLSAIRLNTGLRWYNIFFAISGPAAIIAYELFDHLGAVKNGVLYYGLFILAALISIGFARLSNIKHRQLTNRMVAELIRIRFYWSIAGVTQRL